MRRFLVLLLAVVWVATSGAPAVAVADPGLRAQWGMDRIGAPAAWATGTGAGVTIAVVDTGVDLGHEDLGAKLVAGRNFLDTARSPQDDHGHGTHVAGVAAATTGNGRGVAGVAPDARIMPVKALDARGAGSTETISQGIRWATANGARVINLSLGPDVIIGTLFGAGFEDAVNEAWTRGVVVVVAAGNDALLGPAYSSMNALVVTATTREDQLARYASAVGSAKWGLSAPGGAGSPSDEDDILSTWWQAGVPNAYGYLSGTSMAAPHVAGAAAVLLSLGLTPQQTVDRLLVTAKDLGAPGRDPTFGAGRLDVAKAVSGLRPSAAPVATATAPPPPPTTAALRTTTTRPQRQLAAPATTTTTTPPTTTTTTAPPATTTTAAAPPSTVPDVVAAERPQAGAGDDSPSRNLPALALAAVALLGSALGVWVLGRRPT